MERNGQFRVQVALPPETEPPPPHGMGPRISADGVTKSYSLAGNQTPATRPIASFFTSEAAPVFKLRSARIPQLPILEYYPNICLKK
jgi:hypothetical protein